jgi:hypothetical protein
VDLLCKLGFQSACGSLLARNQESEAIDALIAYMDAPGDTTREALIAMAPGEEGRFLVALGDALLGLSPSQWDQVTGTRRHRR